MILFQNDWAKYPNAIADIHTRNESYLRLARLYKSMGIRNHMFHLALLQPELQGVDPYDPNLTLTQKGLISQECKWNPWYYFREISRLPARASSNPIPLEGNRGNIALFFLFLNHIDAALIQPRQTGKSVSADTLITWPMFIGSNNTTITMITKDNDLRKKNVERLKEIRDLLPKYLVDVQTSDADNQIEITHNANNNHYSTAVAQNSEANANNTGRGFTAAILHSDEGPFTNFINVTLPAALAAGTAAREEAAKFGRPYGNLFTTTAGKKDGREGRFMYDLIHDGAVWTEKFFDARDEEHLYELVSKQCRRDRVIVNLTLSHKQLGKSDEWLRKAIANAGGTRESIERDFLNVWTSGSLRSPLTIDLNNRIAESDIDPVHMEVSPENYMMRWYIPEHEIAERMQNPCALGMDTSDAVGRDAITLVLTDLTDMSNLAVGTFNETNLVTFATFLTGFLVKYKRVTLVPERNRATMILDYLNLFLPRAGEDPFKRIFNYVVQNADADPDGYKEILKPVAHRSSSFYDQRKSKMGFYTGAQSRETLYGTVLQNAAKNAGHLVRDRSLSSEIRGLVEKNGRIDHQSSGHDDHVISWLLNHWFVSHAKNLHHYGIDSKMVMMHVSSFGRELSDEEIYRREQQRGVMEEIESLVDRMKNVDNETALMQLEHRLRVLSMRVGEITDEGSFSIDQIIKAANEERGKRQHMQSLMHTTGDGGFRPLDMSRNISNGTYSRPQTRDHNFTYY